MPTFDYINSNEFRESLENDYAELQKCLAAGAWKSVQVIAGSIVESILIDYLVSTKEEGRTKKDPLKLDLAEIVSICRTEKVLSDRTADLCSVIRSYRNLIHPGRVVRLRENKPDKGSATVSIAVVEMITVSNRGSPPPPDDRHVIATDYAGCQRCGSNSSMRLAG